MPPQTGAAMKLTSKSLRKWLWFITQTAKVEELPCPPDAHEPMSFKARDDKAEKAKRRAK